MREETLSTWGKKIKQISKILQRFSNLISWFISKANSMAFWVCPLQWPACFQAEECSLLKKTQFVFQKRMNPENMKFVKLHVFSVRGATSGGRKYTQAGSRDTATACPPPRCTTFTTLGELSIKERRTPLETEWIPLMNKNLVHKKVKCRLMSLRPIKGRNLLFTSLCTVKSLLNKHLL